MKLHRISVILLSILMFTFLFIPAQVVTTQTFNYSGATQTFVIPQCATTLTFYLEGATGHEADGYYGYGGKGTVAITPTPGVLLYFNVGGAGSGTLGGFNGGGNGGQGYVYNGGGGGGATDIRLGGNALSNRIIVIGGGGGSGVQHAGGGWGGDGGGPGCTTWSNTTVLGCTKPWGCSGYSGSNYGTSGTYSTTCPGSTLTTSNASGGGGGGLTSAGGAVLSGNGCFGTPGGLGYGGNGGDSACTYGGAISGNYTFPGSGGGGGGGGYYGGGGGMANAFNGSTISILAGGGGGGSSYVDSNLVIYYGFFGYGGAGYNPSFPTQLGNGKIIVYYTTSGPVVGVTASAYTVCSGSPVNLTATGAASYTWLPVQGFSGSTGSSVIVTPLQTTQYTVTGSNSSGCLTQKVVTIAVNTSSMQVTALPGPSVCMGSTVSLTATGAANYTWLPAQGFSGSTGSSVIVTPLQTTQYTVTGSNSSGCLTQKVVTIAVNTSSMQVTALPGPSVCMGSTVSLTANGAASYSWLAAQGFSGSTGASVIVTPLQTTQYTVTGTNSSGCLTNTVITILVNSSSVQVTALPGLSVCMGNTVSLTANGAANYTWLPAQGFSGSISSSVLVTPLQTTQYTVTGSNSLGCFTQTVITIAVNTSSMQVTALPAPSVCKGSTVSLTATGAASYSWLAAQGFSGSTGASVIVTPLQTTQYTVTGTNSWGCLTNTVITILVNSSSVQVTALPGLSVCMGNTVSLTASGLNSYTWSGGIQNGVPFAPASTSVYVVTGADTLGCIKTHSMQILVGVQSIFITGANNICAGGSLTLSASPGGFGSYLWNTGDTIAQIVVSPSTSTSYTVSGSASGGTCSGSSSVFIQVYQVPAIQITSTSNVKCLNDAPVKLAASGALTYTWSATPGTYTVNGGLISVNPVTTTHYTVTGVNAAGCRSFSKYILVVDACVGIMNAGDLPLMSIYPNPSSGDFVLTAENSFSVEIHTLLGAQCKCTVTRLDSGRWYISGLSSGTYLVKVKDLFGKETGKRVLIN